MNRYCFFLDIDGCIFKHQGNNPKSQFDDNRPLCDNVTEFFELCGKYGHIVILTTGRKNSMKELTEKQLHNAGISYDNLIMGCSNALRVIVNDTKPYRQDNPQTAIAVNLTRDEGLGKLVEMLKKEIE